MAANSQLGVATAVLDVDVTRALSAVNKFVSAMGKADRSVRDSGDAADVAEKKVGRLRRTLDHFWEDARSEIFGNIGTRMFDSVVRGITGIVAESASFETLKTRLEVATGSAERMEKVWKDIGTFAAKTPFELPELVEASAQLESMGLDAIKWTKVMGEVSSGTGKDIQDVSRAFIAAQFGEYESMKQLGVSMKREGDNLVIAYYKNGKKIEEIVDASNQEVINSTLEAMWNDRYAGSMEKQSKTYTGMMSTIMDNINMLKVEAFTKVFEKLKGFQTAIIDFFERFDEGRKKMSTFKAMIVALDQAIEAALGKQWALAIMSLIKALVLFGTLIKLIIVDVLKVAKAFKDQFAPAIKVIGPILGVIGVRVLAMAALAPKVLMFGRAFQFLRVAVMGVFSPIGLLIAALWILSEAYKRNFMGFADLVDSAWEKGRRFYETFRQQFDMLNAMSKYNNVEAFFRAIGFAILDLLGMSGRGKAFLTFFTMLGSAIDRFVQGPKKAIHGLLEAIDAVLNGDWDKALVKFRKVLAGIGDFLGAAPKMIGELLASIRTGFKPLDNFLSALSNVFISVGRLIQEIFQGDFRGALAVAKRLLGNLGDMFKNGFALISEVMKRIPWGAMWDSLKNTFKSINWTDLGERAIDSIADALRGGASRASGIWDWITDTLGAIWDRVGPAISEGISLAWDMITSIKWSDYIKPLEWADWIVGKIDNFVGWISERVSEVDWGKYLGIAGGAIRSFRDFVVERVGRVDWGKYLGIAGGAIRSFKDFIVERVSEVDWGKYLGIAGGTIRNFKDFVVEQVGSVDWGKYLGIAGGAISNFKDFIVERVGNVDWGKYLGIAGGAILNFKDFVIEQVGSVDWGKYLGIAGGAIVSFKDFVIERVGNVDWGKYLGIAGGAIVSFKDFIIEQVGSVDWNRLLGVVGGGLGDFGSFLKDEIFATFGEWSDYFGTLIPDFGEWLKGLLPDFGSWDDYVPKIDWATWILNKLKFPSIPAILDFFWDKIKANLPFGGGDAKAEEPEQSGGKTGGAGGGGGGGFSSGYSGGPLSLTGSLPPGTIATAMKNGINASELVQLGSQPDQLMLDTIEQALSYPAPTNATEMVNYNTLVNGFVKAFWDKYVPSTAPQRDPGFIGPIDINPPEAKPKTIASTFKVDGDVAPITKKLQGLFGGSGKTITADPNKWKAPALSTKELFQSVEPIPSKVGTSFSDTLGLAGGYALATDTSVSGSFASLGANVDEAATGVRGTVGSNMADAASTSDRYAKIADQRVTGAFQSMRGNVTNAIGSLPGDIEYIMFGVGNRGYFAAYSAGVAIGQGLTDGLASKQASVDAAAAALGDSAINAMNAAAQVASPSRRAIRTARMIGQGLVVGLGDMVKPVKRVADRLGDAAMPTVGYGFAGGVTRSNTTVVHVNQNFGLRSNEYANVLRKAEGGYAFAEEMTQELTHLRGGR